MAIAKRDSEFYEGMLRAFNPSLLPDLNDGEVLQRWRQAGDDPRGREIAFYGDTLENLFNKHAPQDFRDALVDAWAYQGTPATGPNFELYDNGKRLFHNELLDQHGLSLREDVANKYAQQLGLRPAVNKEAAGLLKGEDVLGEALMVSGLVFGGMGALNGLGMLGGAEAAGAAGAFDAAGMAGLESSFGIGGAGMGGAAAGGTASAAANTFNLADVLAAQDGFWADPSSLGLSNVTAAGGTGGGMTLSDYLSSQDAFWADPTNMGLEAAASGGAGGGSTFSMSDYLNSQDAFWQDPTNMGLTNYGGGYANVLGNLSNMGLSPLQILQTFPGAMNAITKAGPKAYSAVQSLINGGGSTSDLLKLLGQVAPAALGAFGAHQQSKDYRELAEKYMGFGAPSRARYESSFAPGFTMASDPGYKDALDQTTKSFLHKASVTGNPVESPNAWTQTLKDVNASFAYPALQEYRRMNAGAGGLANMAPAAINASGAAIASNKGIYDAIGAGAADVFNPPKSLAEVLRELKSVTMP